MKCAVEPPKRDDVHVLMIPKMCYYGEGEAFTPTPPHPHTRQVSLHCLWKELESTVVAVAFEERVREGW